MRALVFIILSSLLITACGVRRDTPDETKVQAFPAWEPAPDNSLPLPQ